MRYEIELLSDQSKESSDSRPPSRPGSPKRLEQYRKQAEQYEAAKEDCQQIQQKQNGESYALQNPWQSNQEGLAEYMDYKWRGKNKDDGSVDGLLNYIRLRIEVEKIRKMNRYLIIVSNRGPVEYQLTPDQKLGVKSGAGGVSTALASIGNYGVPVEWFSSPMSEGDRKVLDEGLPHNFVSLTKDIYDKYYNEISNKILWFVLHGMDNRGQHNVSEIENSWKSYTQVNQVFADTVHTKIKRDSKMEPIVMIQDYHLLQTPAMLRERHPTIMLQHFIHVPWPQPEVWKELPPSIVKDIYSGMSGNDIIGFQTKKDAKKFLKGAKDYLPDAEINFKNSTVRWQKHDTQVQVYPISVSVARVREIAKSKSGKLSANDERRGGIEEIQKERKNMQGFPEKMQKILRVDRIEPTKNIVQGFQAYGLMLERYPELHGKVCFLSRLVPSRETVPIYQELAKNIKSVIEEINKRYGKHNWEPIVSFFGHDHAGALAEMLSYDVLLVNSIKDGMNLVAKEGVVVNQNDGVLVLSQTAGAFHELKNGVIPLVSPSDLEETAKALKKALDMSLEERKIRAATMRKVVERSDLALWLSQQLHDINSIY